MGTLDCGKNRTAHTQNTCVIISVFLSVLIEHITLWQSSIFNAYDLWGNTGRMYTLIISYAHEYSCICKAIYVSLKQMEGKAVAAN